MPKKKYLSFLFSLYAPVYPLVSNLFSRSRKLACLQIAKLLEKRESKQLLLVGGGDGLDIQFMAANIHITYLDSSKQMFFKAKKKYGSRKDIQFINQDAIDYLNTSNVKYDAIAIHFCLSMTENPKQLLQLSANFLNKNGFISILDIAKPQVGFLSSIINKITKYTMFDLSIDIEKLAEPLHMENKNVLKESPLFAHYIYHEVEN